MLDRRCQRTCQNRNSKHAENGDRIPGQRKVEREIRVGKHVIDEQHAGKRCRYAIKITVGKARNEENRENKQHRHIIVALFHAIDLRQKQAKRHRCKQQDRGQKQIARNAAYTLKYSPTGFHSFSPPHAILFYTESTNEYTTIWL